MESTGRELAQYHGRGGHVIDSRFVALFDGPSGAIGCAKALRRSLASVGVELRAAIHAGECEETGGPPGEPAVDLAQRIRAFARPGEIIVSGTVRDPLSWSGFEFVRGGPTSGIGADAASELYRVL